MEQRRASATSALCWFSLAVCPADVVAAAAVCDQLLSCGRWRDVGGLAWSLLVRMDWLSVRGLPAPDADVFALLDVGDALGWALRAAGASDLAARLAAALVDVMLGRSATALAGLLADGPPTAFTAVTVDDLLPLRQVLDSAELAA